MSPTMMSQVQKQHRNRHLSADAMVLTGPGAHCSVYQVETRRLSGHI